ncbi:Gfo/Idh/MocA family oxidoreductase, partial [Candidatus Sumerlaeota bacterium]|nr:Gfo/Idh/MocA family oxidoreductase [Candidatus Sumerlaeota bacterium]
LTEKPIEITLKKADAMIAGAKKNKVKLGVISQHRTDPGIIELREAIHSGKLGKIILAEAYVKWWRTQEYYDSGGWRGTWKLDGGGALMNQGVHTVDMLQYVMDSPVASVVAQTTRAAHTRIEVEDVAQALLKFKNGALGMIIASTAIQPGFPERIEVTGTKGTIIVEKDRVTYREISGEEKKESSAHDGDYLVGASDPKAISNRGHVLQLQDFCRAIQDGREPLVAGPEGRKPLEIILAIYESAKTGKRVTLR